MTRLATRIREAAPPPVSGAEVILYGSGDFHHLTLGWLARLEQPITVIHFDNHPDWVRWPPAYHCGSWVNRALEMPQVARIVTLGPCSTDLAWPQLKGANLAALANGHLELWPWRHPPSRVWGRVDPGPIHACAGNQIHWRCLADWDWEGFLAEWTTGLPNLPVWVTIDKDVLGPDEAITNWDQGAMPLTNLLTALTAIASVRRILGVDICG